MRKTKIICTVGPASEDPKILKSLLKNGANVIRLNFSHGDYEGHGRQIALIKKIRKAMGLPVAILLDTKGPEIRIGKFNDGKVQLSEGQKFILTTEDIEGDESKVTVHFKELTGDVRKDTTILLDDGLVELVVEDVTSKEIHCKVVNGGTLGAVKGSIYRVYPQAYLLLLLKISKILNSEYLREWII